MTSEAPGTAYRDGFGSWEFVGAFEDLVNSGVCGAVAARAGEELFAETFRPMLDEVPAPTNLETFDNDLAFLDTQFGHAAAHSPTGVQSESLATRLVDGIEDYVLETKVFPLAFPDRIARPLGRVTFRGIGALPGYVEARLKVSTAGYFRITGNSGRVKDIERARLVLRGDYEGAEKIAKRSRDPAREEGDRRDAKLDAQIDRLALRYGRQMERKVQFGDQYRQYLSALQQKAREVGHTHTTNGRTAEFIYTATRGRGGDTSGNVVAKTRHKFLEKVFASIES